jgi:enoyl-CoA hydratase/carnithine racemase
MIKMNSPSAFLEASVDGSTGWLVLNRPERRNALNAGMWAAIPPLIRSLNENPGVRVIVIRGAGSEAFAAGADISEFAETRNDSAAATHYEKLNGEAFAAIRSSARPVIAMVQGFCIGGGLALALAADLRIADRSAVFSLPPARLGLAYPLDGLSDLVATVGAPAAKEMIFTAAKLTAEDAFRIGLIDRLATDIETETRSLAAEIASGAPLTITHAKRAIDFLAKRPGHEDDAEVAWLAARCFDSEDYAEGRAAFLEKRKPLFRGS